MATKVLIVSYYWPPAGGPGVQRWLKFVKYLPEFEIDPVVYIPENPSYPIIDEALVQDISEKVEVIKRPIVEPYKWARVLSPKQTKTISSGIIPKEKKQTFLEKALLYIRGNYFVPDARVGWVKPSVTYLQAYIDQNDISTIITTGPPHSLHLIGLRLKGANMKLRWLADFRDPWTSIGYHDKLKMTQRTKQKHIVFEREVLTTADEIIVTSPTTKKEFAAITDHPIHVITNGYDDAQIPETSLDDTFTIAHVGSLLSERNPRVLWEVLAALKEEHTAFAKALKIKLAGKVSQEVIDAIKDVGLTENLELLGYVDHQEALKLQRQAALLLLIEVDDAKTKGIIAGKLFEYLAAKRPILAIGPKGSDVAHIIASSQSGTYFNYNESKNIEIAVLEWFKMFDSSNSLTMKSCNIEQYHRRSLTKKLSSIIKN